MGHLRGPGLQGRWLWEGDRNINKEKSLKGGSINPPPTSESVMPSFKYNLYGIGGGGRII